MSHHPGDAVDVVVDIEKPPGTRRWAALVLLCLAQFMLIVDITVVQVALPSIGDDFDLARGALTWVVTTYTLYFGGLMVLGGRLADAFGAWRGVVRRADLVHGRVAGVRARAVRGVLIAARAAQGVGAALMSSAALAIVTTTFVGHHRKRALDVWAAIGGTGAALGVMVGGVLTAGPGWEWACRSVDPGGHAGGRTRCPAGHRGDGDAHLRPCRGR